jgi:hypothetical protein
MPEIKYRTDHHAGANAEERIRSRLRNSGGEEADSITKTGDSARRTFTNIHHSANTREHGKPHPGEGDITGAKR